MAFAQKIADDLTLHSVRDEADKERFAAFNTLYNNASEGATCACLLHHHPGMTPEDFLMVESDTTHEIISTTCLIPWDLNFAGVNLRVAQLEMVLTHPEFRGRGLVRTQVQHFEQQVKARDFDLSIIWGIPYYYRQYGYAYAIEGAAVEVLPVWNIPSDLFGENPPLMLRPAQVADIPILASMFDQDMKALDLSARRTTEYWKYLLGAAKHPIEIVEKAATGVILGYGVISRSEKAITILENSLPDAPTALALLHLIQSQFVEQIKISWPQNLPLTALAHSLGGQTVTNGQWLLRIPNMIRFLSKMRPIFEQRLSKSFWRNLSTALTLNLYREAIRLQFEQGKLTSVTSLGFVDSSMGADGGHLCIPPEAFLRLLTGYRSLDELFDAWPDIVVKPESRSVLDTLFPKLQPYLYTPYHYLGPLE